jgi:hypothetical protein
MICNKNVANTVVVMPTMVMVDHNRKKFTGDMVRTVEEVLRRAMLIRVDNSGIAANRNTPTNTHNITNTQPTDSDSLTQCNTLAVRADHPDPEDHQSIQEDGLVATVVVGWHRLVIFNHNSSNSLRKWILPACLLQSKALDCCR